MAKYFRDATDATLTRLYPAWESAYAGLRKNHVGHFSHNDGVSRRCRNRATVYPSKVHKGCFASPKCFVDHLDVETVFVETGCGPARWAPDRIASGEPAFLAPSNVP